MINFDSFGDELQKLAESEYRNITGYEMLLRPEGVIGAMIPLDPAKRERAYRTQTMLAVPASTVAGGILGAGIGANLRRGSPGGLALGAGLGALGSGLGSWGLREYAAKGIRRRAEAEAIRRAEKAARRAARQEEETP